MLGMFAFFGVLTAMITKIFVQGFVMCAKIMWYVFTWPFYLIGWGFKQGAKVPVESYSFRGKAVKNMTGLEYEHAAAQWLVKQGYYSVAVTPPSNDFGADITAKDKMGQVWVFQCKHYSVILDNTPIQEVVASKAHYGATRAGVITNSGFTKAAQQLAAENKVKLITLK